MKSYLTFFLDYGEVKKYRGMTCPCIGSSLYLILIFLPGDFACWLLFCRLDLIGVDAVVLAATVAFGMSKSESSAEIMVLDRSVVWMESKEPV